jgi:hypothetical protein
MQRLGVILLFYKPFFIWSLIANIIITFFDPSLFHAVIAKLFLTIFVWFRVTESYQKRRLQFYNNIGISTFKLFSTLFIIDILIMMLYLLLLKEFI